MRVPVATTVLLLVAGCSSGSGAVVSASPDTSARAPAGSQAATATGPPASVPAPTPDGCPVTDTELCAAAVEIAGGLAVGDVERVVAASRADRVICDDVAAEYFPECAPGAVLRGHGLSDADGQVEVVGASRYRARLDTVLGAVDPAFADALGDGAVRLVGVGTCGPDDPARRSYHLTWTAAVDDGDGSRRVVSSFELTRGAGGWSIVLWYHDWLDAWEATGDPLTESFCAAGLNPWAG